MNELPDPGWGRKRDVILSVVVPFSIARRVAANPLVGLRTVFGVFVVALPLIGIVSVAVTTGSASIEKAFDPFVVLLVVGAIGALLIALPRKFEQDLPCETTTALTEAFRVRFFKRIAFSEASALIGFAALILSGRSLPYFMGAGWTLVGFARLAPTVANLERDQHELDERGCDLRLSDCLQSPPPR